MRISDWSSDVCSSDLGRRKCRTPDPGRTSVAKGSGAKIDGRDQRRTDRYRHGAVGRVPADGLLRRIDRRHLSPVLDHHRLVDGAFGRSEEHTSELQSLMRISYAVFCLKKKNIKSNYTTSDHKLLLYTSRL